MLGGLCWSLGLGDLGPSGEGVGVGYQGGGIGRCVLEFPRLRPCEVPIGSACLGLCNVRIIHGEASPLRCLCCRRSIVCPCHGNVALFCSTPWMHRGVVWGEVVSVFVVV